MLQAGGMDTVGDKDMEEEMVRVVDAVSIKVVRSTMKDSILLSFNK